MMHNIHNNMMTVSPTSYLQANVYKISSSLDSLAGYEATGPLVMAGRMRQPEGVIPLWLS